MSEFETMLWFNIMDGERHIAEMQRTINLPFTPFVGLEIIPADHDFSIPVREVTWDDDDGRFVCKMADDTVERGKEPEEVVAFWEKLKWQRQGS